jgi:hypothetical protein
LVLRVVPELLVKVNCLRLAHSPKFWGQGAAATGPGRRTPRVSKATGIRIIKLITVITFITFVTFAKAKVWGVSPLKFIVFIIFITVITFIKFITFISLIWGNLK